jgi:hypothetical protein
LVSIYTLSDPADGAIRYVGKTKQKLNRRLRRHIADALERAFDRWADTTHRACWLRSLATAPLMEVVEECEEVDANDAERFWIVQFRALGFDLTNHTDGGDGGIISRKPACTDEEALSLYRSGFSTKQVARQLKTCAKRVSRLVRGEIRGLSKKIADDRGNVFTSVSSAAQAYGVSLGAISNNLRGKSHSAAGHTFKYV